jgi:hypothetical protein
MAGRRTGLDLPLPLQFLAGWLAVWLGRVLQEQVDYLKAENRHYHEEGNHQGLGNELIMPAELASGVGMVDRRERLGGLLSFYYRKAA